MAQVNIRVDDNVKSRPLMTRKEAEELFEKNFRH